MGDGLLRHFFRKRFSNADIIVIAGAMKFIDAMGQTWWSYAMGCAAMLLGIFIGVMVQVRSRALREERR